MVNNCLRHSVVLFAISMVAIMGCTKTDTTSGTEDTSASGAAGQAAGGALSASEANGTLAMGMKRPQSSLFAALSSFGNLIPNAWASSSCPTYKTASGSGCTQGSGTPGYLWLDYSDCNFGVFDATWNGVQAIINGAGTATCGTFPTPTPTNILYRQIVSAVSGTTPGTATVTSSFGTTATIDNASTTPGSLGNFDEQIYPSSINGGWGDAVTFGAGGIRTSVQIGQHIYTTLFDHTIMGSLTVTETAGATSRTLSGNLTVYHNLLKVVGNATFNNVVHSDSCCQPISGSIKTTFASGTIVPATVAGRLIVGLSETLTFTGCGTGTYVSPTGTTTNVTLSRCF